MKFFGFTKGCKKWNEDCFFVNENFGFVLDGATGLTKEKYTNEDSDAKWFSNEWKQYLEKHLNNFNLSISEIVKKGINVIKQKYLKFAKQNEVVDFPSSTVAIFRIKGEDVEFFVLGDSPLIVQTKFKNAFAISSPDIELIDFVNLSKIKEYSLKHKIDFNKARQEFPDCINHQILLKNIVGGYHILSDSVEAINYAIQGKMPKYLINKIIVCSDGFAQIFELFKKYDLEKMCNKINCYNDIEKMFKTLCKLQNRDKGCNKFLRTKLRDDSTLIAYIF